MGHGHGCTCTRTCVHTHTSHSQERAPLTVGPHHPPHTVFPSLWPFPSAKARWQGGCWEQPSNHPTVGTSMACCPAQCPWGRTGGPKWLLASCQRNSWPQRQMDHLKWIKPISMASPGRPAAQFMLVATGGRPGKQLVTLALILTLSGSRTGQRPVRYPRKGRSAFASQGNLSHLELQPPPPSPTLSRNSQQSSGQQQESHGACAALSRSRGSSTPLQTARPILIPSRGHVRTAGDRVTGLRILEPVPQQTGDRWSVGDTGSGPSSVPQMTGGGGGGGDVGGAKLPLSLPMWGAHAHTYTQSTISVLVAPAMGEVRRWGVGWG